MAEVSGPQPFDPWFPNRPWTVCFYSYRGGVGRTTLAVNTFLELKSPLLLDLDLEAPGVDEFGICQPREKLDPGFIEYVEEFRRTGRAPSLRPYTHVCRRHLTTEGLLEAGTEMEFEEAVGEWAVGDLSPENRSERYLQMERELLDRTAGLPRIMRAGRRDAQYRRSIATLDWARFYKEEDGYLFFENLRAAALQELGCDFLLVDARTGLSEISGFATGHLADAVVFVIDANSAHWGGLTAVVEAVRKRELRESQPIPRLYVAAKTPLYRGLPDPMYEAEVLKRIEECEAERPFNLAEYLRQVGIDAPWEDAPRLKSESAAYLWLSRCDDVKNPADPDSWVVGPADSALGDPGDLSRTQESAREVAWWIRAARQYCADRAAKR